MAQAEWQLSGHHGAGLNDRNGAQTCRLLVDEREAALGLLMECARETYSGSAPAVPLSLLNRLRRLCFGVFL